MAESALEAGGRARCSPTMIRQATSKDERAQDLAPQGKNVAILLQKYLVPDTVCTYAYVKAYFFCGYRTTAASDFSWATEGTRGVSSAHSRPRALIAACPSLTTGNANCVLCAPCPLRACEGTAEFFEEGQTENTSKSKLNS